MRQQIILLSKVLYTQNFFCYNKDVTRTEGCIRKAESR